MADATWRAGFARLAPLNLTFEAWLYHPQLMELADKNSANGDQEPIWVWSWRIKTRRPRADLGRMLEVGRECEDFRALRALSEIIEPR
jgi:hypothetical protein